MPIHLPQPLEFDWDEHNVNKNWESHRVSWRECEQLFFNSPFINKDVEHSREEERLWALGETDAGLKLFVVFTVRNCKVRVISARKMTSREKRNYDQRKKEDPKV